MGLEKISEYKKKMNLTTEELSERSGVPIGTLNKILSGATKDPKIETLKSIAKILGLSLDDFDDERSLKCSNNITNNDISNAEYEHILKYRSLDDTGKNHIEYELNREVKRVEQIQALELAHPAVIEFHSKTNDAERLLEYFRSASAGTGVFILGNEASEQIAIPNTPENQYADFAIGVDGNSMEPDYHDGDIVLVSQKLELNHGDVGIFIINNKAYIKEYGETELISRNPAAENITISEYDNIVCMGKVIGKLS